MLVPNSTMKLPKNYRICRCGRVAFKTCRLALGPDATGRRGGRDSSPCGALVGSVCGQCEGYTSGRYGEDGCQLED